MEQDVNGMRYVTTNSDILHRGEAHSNGRSNVAAENDMLQWNEVRSIRVRYVAMKKSYVVMAST